MPSAQLDFGAPVPVTELPEPTNRGGRASTAPAFQKWLSQLTPGSRYELASNDPDGAHPANRVAQIRKVAGEAYVIETRAVVAGKRYRIFASVAT